MRGNMGPLSSAARTCTEWLDTFLRMLQLQYVKDMPARESVIIFDEVQRFPMAREYIKHLVADGRFDRHSDTKEESSPMRSPLIAPTAIVLNMGEWIMSSPVMEQAMVNS